MGEWFLFPQSEDIIAECITRGQYLQFLQRRCCKWGSGKKVQFHRNDIAVLADIEGIDFDIVNKDLLDYFHDCES